MRGAAWAWGRTLSGRPEGTAALDVRAWLGTPLGSTAAASVAILLLALVALAGFDFAIGLLLVLIGGPAGLTAAYLVSGPLRRRGADRVPRLLVVWIAYVVLAVLVLTGDLFFGSAGRRAEPSGAFLTGFVQSFGFCSWLLLLPLSRGVRLTDRIGRRWVWLALGLHISGLLAALLIGLLAAVYVLRSSTG